MARSMREVSGVVEGVTGSITLQEPRRLALVDRPAACIEALEGRRLLSAGAPDPTFGSGGEIVTSLPGNDAAVQSDGKIVVAGGKVGLNGTGDLSLVRFNANGSVDGSFGSGGVTVTPVVVDGTLENATGTGVAVLPNGKILVAGAAMPRVSNRSGDAVWYLVVARYNANGSLDTTFGNNGEAVLPGQPIGSPDAGFGVGRLAVLSDGMIVVNAYQDYQGTTPAVSLVAAFTSAGKADTTYDPLFEEGGSPLPGNVQTDPSAIAALPGGQFVVAGFDTDAGIYGSTDGAYAVLGNPGAKLDTSVFFSNDNISYTGGYSASVDAVAAAPGGQLALAGFAQYPSGNTVKSGFALSYGPATTFTSVNGGGSASAVAVEPGGKVVVAGTAPASTGSAKQAFVLLRYNPNGSLDSTFGSGGIVVTQAANPSPFAVLVQPGGKIVVVGHSDDGNLILLRFQGDTPATVTGTVFNDKNGNGVQNTGETGLAGVQIYADLNNVGIYQTGDPTTTTNSKGQYTLSGLVPGQYIIRQVLPKGYHQTTPSSGLGIHLSILAGQTLIGESFGDQI